MSPAWDDDLSTKIEWIDNQHKELIAKASALVKASEDGKGKEALLETLRFLGDYVITHFRDEENLQLKYNYPYYPAHKAIHDQFIKDFLELKNQIINNGVSSFIVYEVKKKLIDWIKNHINLVDKAMADYLIQHHDLK